MLNDTSTETTTVLTLTIKCAQRLEISTVAHSDDHRKLWKVFKEMGIPDHLACLLRNLYAGQGATIRTLHGATDWFKIGKGVCQGYILLPCLFNL